MYVCRWINSLQMCLYTRHSGSSNNNLEVAGSQIVHSMEIRFILIIKILENKTQKQKRKTNLVEFYYHEYKVEES